jgi:hypothetical protein
MSRRITVRNCSIYDTSRAGININEGTWGGHLIEGCDVFKTVQETGDHGSFNSWGRDRYWIPTPGGVPNDIIAAVAADPNLPRLDAMEKTIIRNSRWRCDHGWDIDLDDGSTNYEITNNLLLCGGLKLREGYNRVSTNNIIVNNALHPHVWFPNSGDVFTGNIVMSAYKPAVMSRDAKWGWEVDRNLFTTSHKDRLKFAANGADANSLVGDPDFADPATGDYTVRNEALAKAIGFKNFPMDRFGVQKPSLKAIAKAPELPQVRIKPDLTKVMAAKAADVTWMGATFSEPKGEALSAYGVPFDSGGVAVETLPANSSLAGTQGLQKGDLIQSLNGKRINGIGDLKAAMVGVKDGRLTMRVVRTQKEITLQLTITNPSF